MKLLNFSALLCSCMALGPVLGQDDQWWLEDQTTIRLEHALAEKRTFHTSLKPFLVSETDSALDKELFIPGKKGQKKETYIRVAPNAGVHGVYGDLNFNGRYGLQSEAGLDVGGAFKKKWFLNLNFVAGNMHLPAYAGKLADSLGALPGYGSVYKDGPLYSYQVWGGHLSWQPSSHFHIQAGRGANFWGEGYRSLLLSDASTNYNYFRALTNVWRVKYAFMVGQFDNASDFPSERTPWSKKFSAMHFLSFNVTDWWNIALFEAVVWESEDSAINRGLDIHYLNPLIFFRPVEYSLGSSDNSLIGAQTVVKTGIGLHIYAQVLLDEFLLDSVMAGNGWYANKQAVQLGMKWFDPVGSKNTFLQLEGNYVRPFVYGHSNAGQSYTHRNLMLAHPLGANFFEWVARCAWFNEKTFVSLTGTLARKGFETTYNNGANPLRESGIGNLTRASGYETGNGAMHTLAQVRAEASYMLIKQWNLRVQALVAHRWDIGFQKGEKGLFAQVGIQTAFRNNYRDY